MEQGKPNGHDEVVSPMKRVLLRTMPELKDELAPRRQRVRSVGARSRATTTRLAVDAAQRRGIGSGLQEAVTNASRGAINGHEPAVSERCTPARAGVFDVSALGAALGAELLRGKSADPAAARRAGPTRVMTRDGGADIDVAILGPIEIVGNRDHSNTRAGNRVRSATGYSRPDEDAGDELPRARAR